MKTRLSLALLVPLICGPNAFTQVPYSTPKPLAATTNQPATTGFTPQTFNLGGIWQWDLHQDAPKVRLVQKADTLNIYLLEGKEEVLIYKGHYASASLVLGQELASLGTSSAETWASKAIYVDDPDHIRFERGAPFVRISDPLPTDAVCDFQNSSHVKSDFALARGMYASSHNLAREIRVCWVHASALGGNPEAQYAIAMAYRQAVGVPKDDSTAFSWAQKSAAGGSLDGEELLAQMYSNGIGTTPSPQKAQQWLARARAQRQQQQTAAWKDALFGLMQPMAKQALQDAQDNIQKGLPTEEEIREQNERIEEQNRQEIDREVKEHSVWGP